MAIQPDDIEQKLEELNNKLSDVQSKVRSLYRAQWWGRAWSFLYLFVVIGVAGGIFYYTKPYLDLVLNASQKVNSIPVDALNSQLDLIKNFLPR